MAECIEWDGRKSCWTSGASSGVEMLGKRTICVAFRNATQRFHLNFPAPEVYLIITFAVVGVDDAPDIDGSRHQ